MSLRAGPDRLGEGCDADPHEALPGLSGRAALRLLGPQVVVPGDAERLAKRALVVPGVVDPAGAGGVGELLGADQVAQPQLHRVEGQLPREQVDHPFDEVDRLGDAERARVGDAAGCLVRVHGGHRAVGGLQVVGAGEDAEEAAREPQRRGGAVEGAVVGEHVAADREDAAGAGGGDLAGHRVVAGERAGGERLGAVLGPLHRATGDHRGGDRADVAGIDRHLGPEAAADVGRDDPDPVLRDAGEHRVEDAVRVRRLAGAPQCQPLLHPVPVGHRRAGLQGRRVDARERDLLLDDDVGGAEDRLGRDRVAGLPVEAVVVRLARDVVADQRRTGVERVTGVDDRLEDLVVDLDELEGVAGGVPVLGDDERDLLAREADLVGGEHGLPVAGERGHPGDPALGEHRAADHRPDLRVHLGGGGVEVPDPGVRDRCAQDRQVEHAGQPDVVGVAAQAAHEPAVLLAEHPAVAERRRDAHRSPRS